MQDKAWENSFVGKSLYRNTFYLTDEYQFCNIESGSAYSNAYHYFDIEKGQAELSLIEAIKDYECQYDGRRNRREVE